MATYIDLDQCSTGGGGGVDPVGLKDIAQNPIDPATKQKQDEIISALGDNGITNKLLQVDGVGTTTYLGYADPGSLTSGAVWAIKRIIESGSDASITWADGDASFDNIWDNRLALVYA
jgi:hypothetical protein